MTQVRAAVLTGPSSVEVREFPRPVIGDDDAIVRIEACGLCGSDVEQVKGHIPNLPLPAVAGHEPLGVIDEIGPAAAKRWGVEVGDRVVIEVIVPCRECENCATGVFSSCTQALGSHGYRPVKGGPEITGGFAEYMYVHPNSVLHKMDGSLPPVIAAMFNPLAAGIRWAVHIGGVKAGDTVAVLGAGQRGIAAAMAAKSAGASRVIVTGLERDAHKLALALEFGADDTIFADTEDVPTRIKEITGGRGVDVVLDLTPLAAQPVRDAIASARSGGTVVLAGLKSGRMTEIDTDMIVKKALTVRGALGVEGTSIAAAIKLLESRAYPFEKLHTHTYGLDEVVTAIDVLAGEVPGEDAIHIAIVPN